MPETELELDVDILKSQGKVYSSLTDINGIPIFTTEFKGNVEKLKENEKEADEYFNSLAFSESMEEDRSEEELKQVLFQGQMQQVVKKTETEEDGQISVYPFLAAAFILFFIITGWYYRRRSRKIEEKKKALGEEQGFDIKGEEYGRYK